MKKKIRILENRFSPFQGKWGIFIGESSPDGQFRYEIEVKKVPINEGEFLEPSFFLGDDEIGSLIAEIKRVGLVKDEAYNRGRLDATEKHLEDMRYFAKVKGE